MGVVIDRACHSSRERHRVAQRSSTCAERYTISSNVNTTSCMASSNAPPRKQHEMASAHMGWIGNMSGSRACVTNMVTTGAQGEITISNPPLACRRANGAYLLAGETDDRDDRAEWVPQARKSCCTDPSLRGSSSTVQASI